MAAIQRRIVKQGKRNVVSRHLHAKNDKERIAAWNSDLTRILDVFNVCSTASVRLLLTLDSQTELAISTHVTVSNTHVMVSNIHRTIMQGQEGSGGKNLLVSNTRTLAVTE